MIKLLKLSENRNGGSLDSMTEMTDSKDNTCDKSAMNFDGHNHYTEHFTPKKSKEYIFDLLKSPKRKSSLVSISSPACMSLDNSFNIEPDKLLVKETSQPIYDAKMSHDHMDKTGRSGLQRMDSGFLDHLSHSNVTMCNSRYNHTLDGTRSFHGGEVSNVRWKRFDSGFHDETSSEFSQHVSCNDSMKYKRYSPVPEYLEDKENIVNFNNFNKYYTIGSHQQETMSDIFAEDVVAMRNTNFSSTPSKNHLK